MKVKIHKRIKDESGAIRFEVYTRDIQYGSLKILNDSQVIFNNPSGSQVGADFNWKVASPSEQADSSTFTRFDLMDDDNVLIADVLGEVLRLRKKRSIPVKNIK